MTMREEWFPFNGDYPEGFESSATNASVDFGTDVKNAIGLLEDRLFARQEIDRVRYAFKAGALWAARELKPKEELKALKDDETKKAN